MDLNLFVNFTCILLFSLGILWAGYLPPFINLISNGAINAWGWTNCKLGYFLWYCLRHYSSALLTMMSVEKFIALYFPLKTKSICTVKTAKWASGIAFVFFSLINSFWFYVMRAGSSEEDQVLSCLYDDYYLEHIALHMAKVDATLYSYLPFAVMGLANIAIIYKFIKAKLAIKRAGTESTNQALGNAAMRGTSILITVTLTFLILTVPTNIVFAISLRAHPLVAPFLYLLVCLNHAINGFLYCIVGTRFRKELIATLCCNRKAFRDTETGISMATSVTTITSVKSG